LTSKRRSDRKLEQCKVHRVTFYNINIKMIIFDSNKNSKIRDWKIINDVVMGGKSSGSFTLGTDGFGVFAGNISLENNGGFASIHYPLEKINVQEYTKCLLHIKGDGKKYQFRVKSNSDNNYSYIASFLTSGKWQEIKIPLKEMVPSYRGRKLDLPNFDADYITEIAFLIGNKTMENFKLMIDKIELE